LPALARRAFPLIHIFGQVFHHLPERRTTPPPSLSPQFPYLREKLGMQHLNDIPVKQTLPGFYGKMVHGETSSLVFWDIKKGGISPEHRHVHEQITYITEGELEMIIGGEKYLFTAGTVHVIPSNVPHSALAITDCKIIDSFAPARDDYR
jgi:quercetin dioxygenase-like cupin family protein